MLFSIKLYAKPGSQKLRDIHRQAHLDYLKRFDGQTLFAGPFLAEDNTTELGSMRLLDFPGRAAAEKHVAEEPYLLGGCQERPAIHRWRPGVPHTWRDCPRKEGNEQFYVFVLDKPGSTALRARIKDVNRKYMEGFAQNVMVRGPLLSGDGEDEIGTTMLLDFPGMAEARAFLQGAPYNREGLWGQVEFYRWRFGRIFDRLKVK